MQRQVEKMMNEDRVSLDKKKQEQECLRVRRVTKTIHKKLPMQTTSIKQPHCIPFSFVFLSLLSLVMYILSEMEYPILSFLSNIY